MQQQQNNAVLVGYGVTKAEAAKILQAAAENNAPAQPRRGLFASMRKAFR